MVSQTPGKGANYMVANVDDKGVPLSGSKNYKVTLPPDIPAANFWSMTLYDAANSSGLDNGQPFPSLGSRDKPEVNADGTIDLTARTSSALPRAGVSCELDAIAAVVIGGTSLSGGVGSIAGTLLGALIIGTINNGPDLFGVSSAYQ